MKKTLSLLMLLGMLFQLAGGAQAETTGQAVQFPLENPVSFTIMVRGIEPDGFQEKLDNNRLYQDLKEKTNVEIKLQFLGTDPKQKLSLLMNGDSYGDVLWGNVLNSNETSRYISAGKLVGFSEYVNETYMPNLSKEIAANPIMKNYITFLDGNIYTLPKITGQQGHYLESPMWINKAWLDKLNLDVPTTLAEFKEVLVAFATQDPNGNGIADEIPYLLSSNHNSYHTEVLLGVWGLPTKSSTDDSFVSVVDGEVKFVPIQEEYKAYIKYMADLYQAGAIWDELFTANTDTINASMTTEPGIVGVFTAVSPITTSFSDEYELMLPPKAEGYEPRWYYHPASNGSKNQFAVTDKAQNLDVLMAYLDHFYDTDIAMALEYGLPGEGRILKDDNGKYSFITNDAETNARLREETPTLFQIITPGIRALSSDAYENRIELGRVDLIKQANYALYKDIINPEVWPRPYIEENDAEELNSLSTDIFYIINNNRALWITGKADVDAEWEGYLKALENAGVSEYVRILQESYDSFLGK